MIVLPGTSSSTVLSRYSTFRYSVLTHRAYTLLVHDVNFDRHVKQVEGLLVCTHVLVDRRGLDSATMNEEPTIVGFGLEPLQLAFMYSTRTFCIEYWYCTSLIILYMPRHTPSSISRNITGLQIPLRVKGFVCTPVLQWFSVECTITSYLVPRTTGSTALLLHGFEVDGGRLDVGIPIRLLRLENSFYHLLVGTSVLLHAITEHRLGRLDSARCGPWRSVSLKTLVGGQHARHHEPVDSNFWIVEDQRGGVVSI